MMNEMFWVIMIVTYVDTMSKKTKRNYNIPPKIFHYIKTYFFIYSRNLCKDLFAMNAILWDYPLLFSESCSKNMFTIIV